MKIRSVVMYFLLGLTIASLFFAFEFLEGESNATILAKKQALVDKKENSKELAKIKAYVEKHNPELYSEYLQANQTLKKSRLEYNQSVESDKFLGFKNFKMFAYSFFPTLLLLFYVIYHLYLTTKSKKSNLGVKLIHKVFLLYLSTRLYWAFQPAADLSKGEYYILAIITTVLVSFSVWLFHKKELTWNRKVKKKLMKVSYYAMVNCEEDKAEDMAKIIEQPIK
ncbi:hypothetical protein [Tenacibaculum jejuense]|uniref:Uncharacterized protein n=1 Tax=Tenacibaculum jejuense TaxID=584609 RepID=A0A238U7H4_9FLAO|nr:hypothetical protein [Tenacibaculum jejuense]SNR14548.1 membrane protein of unknown function [Tenacibaculum jejuense]